MRTSKTLSIIGFVAAAVAVACLIGWYASRDKASNDASQTNGEPDLEKTNSVFKSGPTQHKASEVTAMDAAAAKKAPRDVFAYVIHEGKVRAPAGAIALLDRLRG